MLVTDVSFFRRLEGAFKVMGRETRISSSRMRDLEQQLMDQYEFLVNGSGIDFRKLQDASASLVERKQNEA
ncbi:hypothetical protein TNCV_2849201 [Trichonephila clavipes]|nr:hypothetical protein TNCV_2849201 [Trichonephila clavipes]